MNFRRWTLCAFLLLSFPALAHAQGTFTWNPAGGGAWTTPANWTVVGEGADYPGFDGADTVVIPNAAAARTITIGAALPSPLLSVRVGGNTTIDMRGNWTTGTLRFSPVGGQTTNIINGAGAVRALTITGLLQSDAPTGAGVATVGLLGPGFAPGVLAITLTFSATADLSIGASTTFRLHPGSDVTVNDLTLSDSTTLVYGTSAGAIVRMLNCTGNVAVTNNGAAGNALVQGIAGGGAETFGFTAGAAARSVSGAAGAGDGVNFSVTTVVFNPGANNTLSVADSTTVLMNAASVTAFTWTTGRIAVGTVGGAGGTLRVRPNMSMPVVTAPTIVSLTVNSGVFECLGAFTVGNGTGDDVVINGGQAIFGDASAPDVFSLAGANASLLVAGGAEAWMRAIYRNSGTAASTTFQAGSTLVFDGGTLASRIQSAGSDSPADLFGNVRLVSGTLGIEIPLDTDGTAEIDGTLSVEGGNLQLASAGVRIDGNSSVSGEFGFRQTGGTITLDGSSEILRVVDRDVRLSGGTFVMTAGVLQAGDGTGDVFRVSGAPTFTLTGGTFDVRSEFVLFDGAFTAGAAHLFRLAGPARQEIGGAVNPAFRDLELANTLAGPNLFASGAWATATVNGTLTVSAPATLSAAGKTLDCKQGMVLNAAWSQSAGEVRFSASVPQTISGSSGVNPVFADLTLANSDTNTPNVIYSAAALTLVVNGVLRTNVSSRLGATGRTIDVRGPAAFQADFTQVTGTFLLSPSSSITVSNGIAVTIASTAAFSSSGAGATRPVILSTAPGTDRFSFRIIGGANVDGLVFRSGNAAGLQIGDGSTIDPPVTRFRNVSFHDIAPAGRHLTVLGKNDLAFDAPGCFFDTVPVGAFNVEVSIIPGKIAGVTFEDRSDIENGPGRGESRDLDTGGGVANWVYTADPDVAGGVQLFPVASFDFNSFAVTSILVTARDVTASEDRIWVYDPATSRRFPYSYTEVHGATNSRVVGPVWWDEEGGQQVAYYGTTDGRVHRLTHAVGASLALDAVVTAGIAAVPDSVCVEITSPIVSDGTSLFFGGMDSDPLVRARLYSLRRDFTGTPAIQCIWAQPYASTPTRIVSFPAMDPGTGTTFLFAGSDHHNGSGHVSRVVASTGVFDRDNTQAQESVRGPVAFVRHFNEPDSKAHIYAADLKGVVQDIDAFTPTFLNHNNYPYSVSSNKAIPGGVYVDPAFPQPWPNGRVYFGDEEGVIYALKKNPTAGWVQNTDWWKVSPPGTPNQVRGIEMMPLFRTPFLYIGNKMGELFVLNGTTTPPTLLKTFSFGSTGAITGIGRDPDYGRLYVGTSTGHIYVIRDGGP